MHNLKKERFENSTLDLPNDGEIFYQRGFIFQANKNTDREQKPEKIVEKIRHSVLLPTGERNWKIMMSHTLIFNIKIA